MRTTVFIFVVLLTRVVFPAQGDPDVIQAYTGSIHADSTLKYPTLTGWEGATAGDRDSGKVDCWQNEVWMQIDFADDGDSSMVDTISTDTILWTVYLASKPADSIFVFGLTYSNLTFLAQDTAGVSSALWPDQQIEYNSYAVRHSTKSNNLRRLSGNYIEYGNGKAFHIERPLFIEDDDDTTYMNIAIDTGNVVCSLFVLETIRDNGAYPAKIETRIEVTYRTSSKGYSGVSDGKQVEYMDHLDNTYSGDLYVYAVHGWLSEYDGRTEEAMMGIIEMNTDVSPPSKNDGHYPDSILLTSGVYDNEWGASQTIITWIVPSDIMFNVDTTFYVGVAGWDWMFYCDQDYTNDTILWGSYFNNAYGGTGGGACDTACSVPSAPSTCEFGTNGDCANCETGSTGAWEEKFGIFWVTFQERSGTVITNTYLNKVTIQ